MADENSISLKVANQIKEYQMKLSESLKDIKFVKSNMEYDMLKFGFITFVSLFFLFIMIHSTYKTYVVYDRKRTSEKYDLGEAAIFKIQKDDNTFFNDENNINFKNEIERSIQKASTRQHEMLKTAKLEKRNTDPTMKGKNIKDVTLHSQIDINSIDHGKDNNEYSKSMDPRSGGSFWDMLFIKTDYANI
jgi:hypothetical protein